MPVKAIDMSKVILKRCSRCCRFLPLSEFSIGKDLRPRSRCMDCGREHSREQRVKYPERHREIRRKSQFKRKYGISINDYNTLFKNQGGKCAICKTHQNDLPSSLVIDHDHITDRVRGLLCSNCNLAIGLLKENVDTLDNAIIYLNGQH